MHSTTFDRHPNITFLHHGDFSGDVEVVFDDLSVVKIPFSALVSLVAKWAREVRLAKLEGASEREVLGLPP
jgi:hypothetical protein